MGFLSHLLHILGFFLKPVWVALVISSPILVVYYDFGGVRNWLENKPNLWIWLTLPSVLILIRKLAVSLGNFIKDDEQ